MPNFGKIGILTLTDKQFEKMELFFGCKPQEIKTPNIQLEMF